MKKIKELFIKYKEIIMYLIFGVATTGVNWVVYSLLMKAVLVHAPGSDDVKMTVSNVIAWIAAVIFAFITNKLWVFESKSWVPKVAAREFVSFVASRLATGVIEWLCSQDCLLRAGGDPQLCVLQALGIHQKEKECGRTGKSKRKIGNAYKKRVLRRSFFVGFRIARRSRLW